MKDRFQSRFKTTFIFFFSLSFLSLCLTTAFYFYFDLHNGQKENLLRQKIQKLESLKKASHLRKIKRFLGDNEVRLAFEEFSDFKRQWSEVESGKNGALERNKALETTTKEFRVLTSLPSLKNIIEVLRKKVRDYASYNRRQNYRNLSRIGARMEARVNGRMDLRPKKILATSRLLFKEIERSKKIILNSSLDNNARASIQSRLNSLALEMTMIQSFARKKLLLINEVSALGKLSSQRIDEEISKSVAMRLKRDVISDRFNLILGGTLLFNLMIFILGAMFVNKKEKSNNQESKDHALNIIKNILMPSRINVELDTNNSFQSNIKNLRSTVQKRFRLGNIFDEALPFPCFILDSNFKVTWGNPVFLDCFKAESNDDLDWNFVRQRTNLEDSEIVLDALKKNVAGIYQIQLLSDEVGEPFEMYINPVESLGEKQILVLFYPLKPLHETLKHQSRALISPVVRSLSLLKKGQFEGEEAKQLEHDFKTVGVGHVYEQFHDFGVFAANERNAYLKEVDDLNSRLKNLYQLVFQLFSNIEARINDYSKDAIDLKTLRDVLLIVFERLQDYEGNSSSLRKNIEELELRFSEFTKREKQSFKLRDEVKESLDKRDGLLKTLSTITEEGQESKYLIQEIVDKVGIRVKSESTSSLEDLSLAKTALKKLGQLFAQVTKKQHELETFFTRLNFLINSENLEADKKKFLDSEEEKKELLLSIKGLSLEKDRLDHQFETIVQILKDIKKRHSTSKEEFHNIVKSSDVLQDSLGHHH